MRHQSLLLNSITVFISGLCIILALLIPNFMSTAAPWIVIASVFIVGIPHGAIDHIMAAELYQLNQTLKDHLLFYASYLLIMLLVGLLWVFLPAAGMILFLAISIYHFGQADMEEFLTGSSSGFLWHLNRGLLIIGLIIFSEPSVTYPIISDAIHINTETFAGIMPDAFLSAAAIIFIYILSSLIGIFRNRIHNPKTFAADSLLLIALLLITGPLIGFAVYFALWHSAGHINEMKNYFTGKGKTLTTVGFYIKALPFTLISILGLILLVALNFFLNMQNQFLTLMFILISVLTLPHMFIVDKMYTESKG